MTTIDVPPSDYPPEITGYAEPWIASPGDTVEIKVGNYSRLRYHLNIANVNQISSTESEYTYQTVRLIQGVSLEHSPKPQSELISAIPGSSGKGRFQVARAGSYASVKDWVPVSSKDVQGLEVSFYFQPWLPKAGHPQALVSTLDTDRKSGFAAVITAEGTLEFWVGNGQGVETVSVDLKLEKKRWVEVRASFKDAQLSAQVTPLSLFAAAGQPPATIQHDLKSPMIISPDQVLLFGAIYATSPVTPSSWPTSTFNGRLDSPCIKTTDVYSTTLVKFDFSRDMSSDRIVDISGNGNHGTLVNAPTRAVKGYDWDGSENDWTKATYGYGAIHFHEDDCDDAAWETDFKIQIPKDARSGAYAVEVSSEKASDSIPFFVRPSEDAWKKREGKVVYVMPTFTYLAYANEQLHDRKRASAIDVGPNFDINDIAWTEDLRKMKRRSDLGLSHYDYHNDGSGVVYSSAKRPILNMRPNYYMWAWKRPREFSADTLMIGFLEREKIPYEVVTDHDLHERGVAAISGFNTAITGSHPEYPSLFSYNAYTAYARQGGNLMYLGGNGFYWVTSTDIQARPHRMEVRRGDQGVRSVTLDGGERVHNIDSQQGGLWRSRGRACNVLFGIGMCGEGATDGVPYGRSELSKKDKTVAWMFDGIGEDELIGEHGFGGGASGDEMDRFDLKNESPECVKVLASSTGHSDDFAIVPEEWQFPSTDILGTQNPDIRSDITYYVNSGGGGVFSVGSINWYCSLGWDAYENNVATLTGNVIKGFLKGLR